MTTVPLYPPGRYSVAIVRSKSGTHVRWLAKDVDHYEAERVVRATRTTIDYRVRVTSVLHDRCATCGADRETIRRDGHHWLDQQGRVAFSDTPNRLPCDEACSCIPECFSMAEHEARR